MDLLRYTMYFLYENILWNLWFNTFLYYKHKLFIYNFAYRFDTSKSIISSKMSIFERIFSLKRSVNSLVLILQN